MWEHSYCQLFPVTVVCANRTEHASFSSNMKTDVVLSRLHLSTVLSTELNWIMTPYTIHDTKMPFYRQTIVSARFNNAVYQQTFDCVHCIKVTQRESYLIIGHLFKNWNITQIIQINQTIKQQNILGKKKKHCWKAKQKGSLDKNKLMFKNIIHIPHTSKFRQVGS